MGDYDAIIIGTGQAGPALALRLAGSGQKVAIVERKRFGGTCINTGCTPTKTMVSLNTAGSTFGFCAASSCSSDISRSKKA
mgnify:CR=1 FL=1